MEFGRSGQNASKYAVVDRHELSQNHQNDMKYDRKWVEIRPPGLRIRLFESQDHDESNGTPPDPKYPNKMSQIDPMGQGRIVRIFYVQRGLFRTLS